MNSTSDEASTSAPKQTTSSSNNTSNQKEGHFVIAKCRRNVVRNTAVAPSNQSIGAQQETSEESDAEEKLLAVHCRSGKLGAAYFTIQTGELFILEEIADRPPEFEMFASLFRQVEPIMVLLDGKNQGSFVQLVKKTVFHDSRDSSCKLAMLSSRDYNFEACKRRIYCLSLPNEPSNCSEDERIMFLRTLIDFSQTQTVHSLGALLRYLDLHWSSISMSLQAKPQFTSLRIISLLSVSFKNYTKSAF